MTFCFHFCAVVSMNICYYCFAFLNMSSIFMLLQLFFFEWVTSEERITRILLLTENGQVLVEKNLLLFEKLEVMAPARRGLSLSGWSIEDERENNEIGY